MTPRRAALLLCVWGASSRFSKRHDCTFLFLRTSASLQQVLSFTLWPPFRRAPVLLEALPRGDTQRLRPWIRKRCAARDFDIDRASPQALRGRSTAFRRLCHVRLALLQNQPRALPRKLLLGKSVSFKSICAWLPCRSARCGPRQRVLPCSMVYWHPPHATHVPIEHVFLPLLHCRRV